MSNTISIRNNSPKVAARLDRLALDVGNRAMVRALNTTVTQGKTQMARKISQEYRISVGKARDRLDVDRASTKNGALRFEATLKATRSGKGRSINIIAFIEKSVTLSAGRRRAKAGEGGMHTLRNGGRVALQQQLRFQIKRGGGKKVIKGAFIGNDGRTVFIRTGKGRTPIKPINTIDIPQMFNARRINSIVREVMIKNFSANFNRELNAILKGFAR